jgi:ABC-2 type transport system permease protein
MIAVCRKELRSYRISMIGYVFIAFMLAVVSLYFAYQNLNLASPRFELVLQNVQFIFLVFVPILTMRVLAEEKKQKTDQLLLTLPMTVKDIVIGKYLAVGFYLLGCANIAIGVFFSSVTENPVISAVMTFGTLLVCYLMNTIGKMVPNTAIASVSAFTVVIVLVMALVYNMIGNLKVVIGAGVLLEVALQVVYFAKASLLEGSFRKVLSVFYMNGRLTNFFDGILDISAIVYYVSVIVFFLFLTVQTIAKRRWN